MGAPKIGFDLGAPAPLDGPVAVDDVDRTQRHTNFVVVMPRQGAAWRVVSASLRGESSEHYATLLLRLSDGLRRLRVKQYWHDWWIPTIPDISFRRPGRPIVWGDGQVSFVGRDYRKMDASCGHVWGTGVECGVEEGTLTDEEWIELWSSFDAAVPEAVAAARASSFAARSYWNRWGRTQGPWDSTEVSSLAWQPLGAAAWPGIAWPADAARTKRLGRADSVGARTGPEGPEVQLVFCDPRRLDVTAWIRVLQQAPATWRPLMDASEVNRPAWHDATVGGRMVRRAAMDADVGNWFYSWRDGDRSYEVHLRARAGLDAPAADALVAPLVRG